MRLSRRRRAERKPEGRHLSLTATDAEWEAVRARAEARGLTIARYLIGLAERDGAAEPGAPCPGPDPGEMALSADEQRELLAAMRELRAMKVEPAPPVPVTAPTAAPANPPDPPPRQGRLF